MADSSAIVAIIKQEAGHDRFEMLIATEFAAMGASSLVETKLALSSFMRSRGVGSLLANLVAEGGLQLMPFTPEMAEAAVDAFRRYGKGMGHPAQLNFGDCMAYAVAEVLRAPLLFNGNDFARTDITPALP